MFVPSIAQCELRNFGAGGDALVSAMDMAIQFERTNSHEQTAASKGEGRPLSWYKVGAGQRENTMSKQPRTSNRAIQVHSHCT